MRAPSPTIPTVTASTSGLTATATGTSPGVTRGDGRPTRLVASGSPSTTSSSTSSSATSAATVERLRPVIAVIAAREAGPP